MKPTSFDLRFTDFKLAESLNEIDWPEGIKLTVSQPFIRASHNADIIVRATIDFHASISLKIGTKTIIAIITGLIARKLKAKVKRRKNKKTKINNKIVSLNERQILHLIKQDIAEQIKRDIQRNGSNKKSAAED